MDYKKILITKRQRESSKIRNSSIEEFYSDHSRIIFCSSFRRLQQKAQVFSLEPNCSVRTRLTHSIEVADVGRLLANKIADELIKKGKMYPEQKLPFIAIVENSCLLHDIGNPPFGHFGEAAIKNWMLKNIESIAKEAYVQYDSFKEYAMDFLEFDGNPQSIRIITRLHCERYPESLNVTYPTLLSTLKYLRAPYEKRDNGLKKKAGYFKTEENIIKNAFATLNMEKRRFPLAYIMEAADDICYCLSDIDDGIEKNIITHADFINDFNKIWREKYNGIKCPIEFDGDHEYRYHDKIAISSLAVDECAANYCKNHKKFFKGTKKQLIKEDGVGRVFEVIKQVSRKRLYRSHDAEDIELSGYAVITGLLEYFKTIMILPYDKFEFLLNDNAQGKNMDYEWRIYNRISKRLKQSYQYQMEELNKEKDLAKELWLRIHMILDYISGMTDAYALEIYQMLKGINPYTRK